MSRILFAAILIAAWPSHAQGADGANLALRFVLAGIAPAEAGERRLYAVGPSDGGAAGMLTVTCRDGEQVAASYAAREGARHLPGAEIVRSGGNRLCRSGRQ